MSDLCIARPALLRELRFDRSAVLEASAGTGKTYALENLVVELVLARQVEIERVLLVTFTERATSELRERVRAKLESLQANRAELASDEDVRMGDFWTLDAAAKVRVTRALHAFDGVTITTIHAFCQRCLRGIAFAGGRLFDETQVDGREAFGRALRDAVRSVANDEIRGPWLEAALRTGWRVSRIEELLWRCAAARADLRPRLDAKALSAALAAWPVELARTCDLHGPMRAWRVHSQTAKAVIKGLSELGQVVERTRSRSLAQYVLEASSLKLDYLLEKLSGLPSEPAPAARVCAAAVELARCTPSFAAGFAEAILPVVTQSLIRTKRETGRYDFDDMLLVVDEALRGPRGRSLVASMRRQWRYAFIDEFQDTDETQWSIFRRAFFEESDSGSPSSVFLVGDPKQSIYRFRGADVATYLSARDAVIDSGGDRLTLDRSYRATSSLVDATNAIFDQDAAEPVFTGRVTYSPVRCGRPERRLVDDDGREVSPVHLLRFEKEVSLSALAGLIAREVALLTDPLRPWRLDGRPLELRDVFVLTRSAKEGRILGEALREHGVPHAFYKEEGLFQSAEAIDLANVLAAIADPSDRAKCLSAWLTPFFGLPLSVLDRARDLPPGHPLVARLLGWKALADVRDFDGLFESLLADSGVVRREIFFGRGERTVTNLQHLVEILTERAQGGRKSVDDLVTELVGLRTRTRATLDIEGNIQRLEGDRPAVQIMTIHKAKGLEAPVVFIAGGTSSPRSEDVHVYAGEGRRLAWVGPVSAAVKPAVKEGEDEEEERLMYVALTRAMARLYLPCVAEGGKAKALSGPYGRVNRRLFDVGLASGMTWTSEDVPQESPKGEPWSRSPITWCPPRSLLAPSAPEVSYDTLRARCSGPVATSYTRMRAERLGALADSSRTEEPGRHAAPSPEDPIGATTLRAARSSGVFIHELLERVPLTSFAQSASIDTWRAWPDVAAVVSEAMAAHRVSPAQRGHAEKLVWAAYTTPIDLPERGRVDRLAAAAHVAREMRYAFPVGGPRELRGGREPATVERAPEIFVRGSIDLVFEHEGLAYFVDWKSDSLKAFAREDLEPHVAEHYREQLALYTLAVVKLLGVTTEREYLARFGGVVYCFLRGMGAEGRGVWSAHPSWADVLDWSDDLRAGRSLGERGRTK
jgi:exodeoxyribonuclease V beta subunit